ncbi:hypothetical protein [Maribacter ulvicola]|uniref:DUF4304 domain-containing protein n=1 Tax=Maribacter ulvicola TaxID=228959 RepID=A0A1N7AWX7_9FLAO|nr:hypothetical protein [Maribacter ulvicola]SIR43502.1 hypothetical protein SAMN05421797_1181 [Maribacter ulvicola]
MNINEFWKIFEKANESLLTLGFTFKGKSWQLENENYKISVEAPSDKIGVRLQVRHLTVCLLHKGIVPFDEDPWNCSEIAHLTPFCISPNILSKFKKSLFKDKVWHFLEFDNPKKSKFYFKPIYYGGSEKQILDSKVLNRLENEKELLNTLKSLYGINYISESECYHELELMSEKIAEYVLYWANRMSLMESINQLEEFGGDSWITNTWKEKYKTLYNKT